MRIIILKTISRPKVMCHFNEGKIIKAFYITEIDEELENIIDDNNVEKITLKLNGKDVSITKTSIKFYGEMDFTTGGDDYNVIKENDDLFGGNVSKVPINYDYKTHSCETEDGIIKLLETSRPEVIVQYFHGLLGKPKRCIIFKRNVYGRFNLY